MSNKDLAPAVDLDVIKQRTQVDSEQTERIAMISAISCWNFVMCVLCMGLDLPLTLESKDF